MAATPEMLSIALNIIPDECCIVPENRHELTTEGGLDVASQINELTIYISKLHNKNILVSLFIDPDSDQIQASKDVAADIIELHTGNYCECDEAEKEIQFNRLKDAAKLAHSLNLQVNAGHGLHYQNVREVAQITEIKCLNIGHSIVARATMTGFHEAVFTMKKIMINARLECDQI